jgi:hypothetical protein
MLSFRLWLLEDAGAVLGPQYNDAILQTRVKSKGSAVENIPEKTVEDVPKCKFLGLCVSKKAKHRPAKSLPEEL